MFGQLLRIARTRRRRWGRISAPGQRLPGGQCASIEARGTLRESGDASGDEKPSDVFLVIFPLDNGHQWRRGRDSNPREAFDLYSLSRGAPSTTRPPLRREVLKKTLPTINKVAALLPINRESRAIRCVRSRITAAGRSLWLPWHCLAVKKPLCKAPWLTGSFRALRNRVICATSSGDSGEGRAIPAR